MTAAPRRSSEDPLRFKLEGVEVARALCVLLVLLNHIHLRFGLNDYDLNSVLPRTLIQTLFWSGYCAVLLSLLLVQLISRIYSEPLDRWLRSRPAGAHARAGSRAR